MDRSNYNIESQKTSYISGVVLSIMDGIAQCSDLFEIKYGELVIIDNKYKGVVLSLQEDIILVCVLQDSDKVMPGHIVKGTKKELEVGVGNKLLGRVINPLGDFLDGLEKVETEKYYPINGLAPKIMDRMKISKPLYTGIKSIDTLVPIGLGQRELIIGPRQSGKTQIAIDTIIKQAQLGNKCIYVAIGKNRTQIADMAKVLDERGALQSTVIVFTSSEDAAYMRVIAPMAGCAIGEYFRDTGNQVLIVYDDLTKHSWAHRQISLLLGLAPGREAYPGDIFYLHARLLERAANVNHSYIKKMSGISAESGSLTALPIIETQGGDLSSFIPTNVISITDGQIVLDAELFNLGIRPALDAGASVSRVGKAAQNKIIRQLSSDVRLFIAQYRELEGFTGLASELDSNTKEKLNRGQKTTLLLTQKAFESVTPPELAIYLLIIKDNLLGDINLEKLIECAKFIVNEIYINENVSFKRLEQDLILTEKENLFFKNLILSKKNIFVQKDNLQTHV